ncbi:MAG: SAM-dependent methyltransferase [Myxococcota bacterium]
MTRRGKGPRHPGRTRREERRWRHVPESRASAPVRVEPPRRVPIPPTPRTTLAPEPGRWLWTCRAGFEAPLYEELAWQKRQPRLLGPALVESDAPADAPPAFARMGFPVGRLATTPSDADAALPALPLCLQVWVPDTEAANARTSEALAWNDALAALRRARALVDLDTPWKAFEAGALLAQICLWGASQAAVGLVPAREALSLAAGGRARMKRTGEAPSRAAMKLDEALEWYGVSPGKGELCVDLGSAPGGWTRRLVERGARVLSVDPAQLAPDLRSHPRVTHVQESAFDFAPAAPVDWLFCDMAWRPLEVAQLLGKWARRRWAAQLVANIKLPMKDKLPVLFRVRHTLEGAGWAHVKMRQLYHDRDEVTVTARRE